MLQDGQDALFAEPADTPALAKTILRLLEDRTLYDKISRNGHDKVHSLFTWEMIAKRIQETVT